MSDPHALDDALAALKAEVEQAVSRMAAVPRSTIDVVNQSTRLIDAQVQTMVAAVQFQAAHHFAAVWPVAEPHIRFVAKGAAPAADAWPLVVLDDPDQAGALGYHATDDAGRPYGRVFVSPVLDAGGGVLDLGRAGVSVASVLSHEVLETLADYDANDWSQDEAGDLWAREVGDPVESWSYPVPVGPAQVWVSDFVLPSFFDPGAPGPWDWSDRLGGSFSLGAGGYAIVMAGGAVTQRFGAERPPEWRMGTKDWPAARTARRMSGQPA